MKAQFKPLGIAAAVAAATAGFAGLSNAQVQPVPVLSDNSLGDLALVPYYTVRGDFGTGVHIINTSNMTQVIKLRIRRGTDSMDALDFNLILSPKDVWTGFLSARDSGGDVDEIVWTTSDNSCTAPLGTSSRREFVMPDIYREGAEEGYIEVIAMAAADSVQPISVAALHDSDGMPADCVAAASNFFADGEIGTKKGVVSSTQTVQQNADGTFGTSNFTGSGNVLKVSYFIRDSAAGLEFGNSATHLEDFLTLPHISNQEFGLNSGDVAGFDFPDLNGGLPEILAGRNRYNAVRAALGGRSVINDWSANGDLNVGTDWVITVPGQYTMLDQPVYFQSLVDDTVDCLPDVCDFRDLPLTATFDVYDREEQTIQGPSGELVVSPQLPGQVIRTLLEDEVNVIEWGVGTVLQSDDPITVDAPDSPFGWAELSVVGTELQSQRICEVDAANADDMTLPVVCDLVDDDTLIPMIGFVAWQRSFPANPDANYGRIINHSYSVIASS